MPNADDLFRVVLEKHLRLADSLECEFSRRRGMRQKAYDLLVARKWVAINPSNFQSPYDPSVVFYLPAALKVERRIDSKEHRRAVEELLLLTGYLTTDDNAL